jgi:hypothetical protein
VDLDVLQAEVKKFLSPSFHSDLEPLCGHPHQLSFLAVNSTLLSPFLAFLSLFIM